MVLCLRNVLPVEMYFYENSPTINSGRLYVLFSVCHNDIVYSTVNMYMFLFFIKDTYLLPFGQHSRVN